MQQDQQTYSRATTAALLGLGTQLLLGVVMAGLGLYTQSGALNAAAWHLFGGLPIWIALWMLYHQHRLERQEALETEQLTREDARAAALFDEAGHNLASARKRLQGFYKWGLNAVSIFVAIYLIAAGLALFLGHFNLHRHHRRPAGTSRPAVRGGPGQPQRPTRGCSSGSPRPDGVPRLPHRPVRRRDDARSASGSCSAAGRPTSSATSWSSSSSGSWPASAWRST